MPRHIPEDSNFQIYTMFPYIAYVDCDSKFVPVTSALYGGEWLATRPYRYTPGENAPGTHWVGGWVGPRVGLDVVEEGENLLSLPEIEPRPSSL
jgi:hypothetical protein